MSTVHFELADDDVVFDIGGLQFSAFQLFHLGVPLVHLGVPLTHGGPL